MAHGGEAADAFHVVVPSLPGFGFSGPTREPGWDAHRTARAWAELMRRLGYDRYGAHGNDAGAIVAPLQGRVDPDHVIGVHVNQIFSFPSGDPAEFEGLTPEELQYLSSCRASSTTRSTTSCRPRSPRPSPTRWPTHRPGRSPGAASCSATP